MTDIDHDRIYEIALDSQLGVTTDRRHTAAVMRQSAELLADLGHGEHASTLYLEANKLSPGPTWMCTNPGCHMIRTTACKPAGCANDRIDTREFRAGLRGHTINDNLDFENGFDQ